MLKHKVCINVSSCGDKTSVLKSGQKTLRSKFLDFFLGRETGVFLLTPGRSVELVEIKEISEGGNSDDTGQSAFTG
jgi:hypothetical protein